MSYAVSGTSITMTRGDTVRCKIAITGYDVVEGDTIRFAMKKEYTDTEVTLELDIPISTMVLTIEPTDTKSLSFGTYVYDIQLTKANGDIDTFIKGKLKLTEEVD